MRHPCEPIPDAFIHFIFHLLYRLPLIVELCSTCDPESAIDRSARWKSRSPGRRITCFEITNHVPRSFCYFHRSHSLASRFLNVSHFSHSFSLSLSHFLSLSSPHTQTHTHKPSLSLSFARPHSSACRILQPFLSSVRKRSSVRPIQSPREKENRSCLLLLLYILLFSHFFFSLFLFLLYSLKASLRKSSFHRSFPFPLRRTNARTFSLDRVFIAPRFSIRDDRRIDVEGSRVKLF